jgi:chromosome segregation ATPase
MSVVPFNTSAGSDAEASAQPEAPDARQRMLGVKRKLEEASGEIEALQSSLASQKELEKLLKQGRAYLQDLRDRLQQTTAERDRLQGEVAATATAHQCHVEQLERQMDGLRAELQVATDERNRLASQLDEREAAHKQCAEQYAVERSTFTRLLDEAASIQRELTEEVQEQRRQIHTLRESAMRAQSFARDIIRAHDAAPPLPDFKPE